MAADSALTLAEHVHRIRFVDLPEPAVVSSKRDILDTLGAALGGSVAPGIAELAELVTDWGGRSESSLWVLGGRVPAPQAALVNAAMSHALDFDDTYDRGGNIHPGISTLAASLAVAELQGGISGQDLVLAVALGLDVACRLALAATVDRGWHRTAAIGIFGATAAAGKLLRLSVEQLVHAFGIAYSQAAGNRQCILDGALTKRLQAGQAASSAVLAALLAQRNFTGARDVFAGRYGFFPMYQPEGYALEPITAGLGTVFRGAELSFKPYPCGRGNHATIDVAMEIYRRLDLASAQEGKVIGGHTAVMHSKEQREPLWSLMELLFKAHPWHGVPIGEHMPERLTVYIEIVPTDTVKYEIDKATGILKVDRPQQFSNVCPALYGFVPQTYCGERVAALCAERTGRAHITGDADPLDICVLAEKTISHGDILLQAMPIGGFRMLDGAEADDKIIAVMAGDAAFGNWHGLSDCPDALLKRLQHYFLTYKMDPGTASNACEITHVFDRDEAHEVIRRSYNDYLARFGDLKGMLAAAWRS